LIDGRAEAGRISNPALAFAHALRFTALKNARLEL
jgi:hypothetical protein